jgi:hypothetical protein
MEVRSVPYIWIPEGVYISVRSACLLLIVLSNLTPAMQLYHTQSQSQRLARVYVSGDGVKVELSQHAMQAHLADVCILCASIFLSGRNID